MRVTEQSRHVHHIGAIDRAKIAPICRSRWMARRGFRAREMPRSQGAPMRVVRPIVLDEEPGAPDRDTARPRRERLCVRCAPRVTSSVPMENRCSNRIFQGQRHVRRWCFTTGTGPDCRSGPRLARHPPISRPALIPRNVVLWTSWTCELPPMHP